ncbi:MAG TPA: VWA domain-containing protein [Clostridiales bacterium]|nr:VWA domain-containing protein [Clostridiales bacterium]
MPVRRIISFILIFTFILSLFAGCSLKRKEKKEDPLSETSQGQSGPGGTQPGGTGTLPAGHLLLSAAEPPNLDGFLEAAKDPIGTPGKDFQLLETGDPDDWGDMPVPLINPLGSRSLYYDTDYKPLNDSFVEMKWLDGVTEVTQHIYGERWELVIEDENLTTNYIRWCAKEIGATLYGNTDDRITFRLEKDNQVWWATAIWDDLEYPEADITVVKQEAVQPGKTLTLKPSDMNDDNRYYFFTKAGKEDFITAFIEIAGTDAAEATIEAFQRKRIGSYERIFEYRKGIEAGVCRRYALNDIPQTDEMLLWCVTFDTDHHTPESVSIRLEKTGSIIPADIGGQPGSLRVIGAPGSATVTLQSALGELRYYSKTYHTDDEISGIIDSEGNTVFQLPAGYYNIKAALPGGGAGGIRMVPVSSGELTEVVLPEEFKSTYASFESIFGDFETNKGSITIHDNVDKGDTAEVSILINDPFKRDVFPEKKDIMIAEGGMTAEILDIKRQTAPVNVVLVIDTSGSMGKFMRPTIEAAKRFVEGLPEKTNISLISFESNITTYKETGKEAVLKNLDRLKANGGTALYDATASGLELLGAGENNFLVVFADGADSRELKGQGKGSDLTRDQVVSKISDSETTVLTIGFGEGHDPQALIAMSMANGKGAYFSANDEAGLDQAFAAVAGKFGNEFVITYKRPEATADIKSEQPVVGVMIDDSGSMDSYRDGVMTSFHEFFAALPEGSLIQFSKFGDSVDMMHMTTDQKAVLMQAASEAGDTGSGTDVIRALEAAAKQLSPLPTNKKVFIFVTDSAMQDVDHRGGGSADFALKELKDEGIRCLFVGVADAHYAEDSFKYAAEMTGGDYIITQDINEVTAKLNELEKKVTVPLNQEEMIPFSIGIRARTEDGSIMDYYATKSLAGFTTRTKPGTALEPRTPIITTGGKMIPLYDRETARLVTGGTRPNSGALAITSHVDYEEGREGTAGQSADAAAPSTMTGSTSYGKSGKNQLIRMAVKDAYTFDVLAGVGADDEKQFIALNMEIDFPKGTATQMEAYIIPSIMQHFYLSVNNGSPVPASKATWLASEPLSTPGNESVTIEKGDKKSGVLVFYADKPERITQLSLHYYDTVYGHIHMPLAGTVSDQLTEIAELPKTQPARITDAFSMSAAGISDQTEYGTFRRDPYMAPDSPEYKQYTVLRTIQVKFDSNVQALLDLDPMERFYYAVDTTEGPLMAKMNNIVYNIPLGFTGKTMLAPGASNRFHMPFEIPEALSGVSSRLIGDISDGSLDIPVTSGSPAKTSSMGLKFSHEYFDLTINSLARSPFSNSYVILDVTVSDKKDGFGTTGLDSILAIEDKNASDDRRYIEPYSRTSEYLYGIDGGWAVLDGQTRRGIMEFSVSSDTSGRYVLRSPYFPDMAVKISADRYPYPELLAMKHLVKVDTDFEDELDEAVSKAIARYEASKPAAEPRAKTLSLSSAKPEGTDIPAPAASVFGSKVLDSLTSVQDFFHVMYAIRWLPSGSHQNSFYAPEAVLAQGWGTENDMFYLAEHMLARLGIESQFRQVKLLNKGKEALMHLSGVDRVPDHLPALAFTDESGGSHIFVVPFMRDATELSGLIWLPSTEGSEPKKTTVRMTITATVEGPPESEGSGQSGLFDAFSEALGGSSEDAGTSVTVTKEIELLSEELSIPSLSLSPIDIGYNIAAKSENGGDLITAVVSTTDGLLQGSDAIDTGLDRIKSVTVSLYVTDASSGASVHTTILESGQKLTDICHTLGFGLPEMGENTVNILMQESRVIAASSGGSGTQALADASNASKVRWFTRNALYRYIAARTAYDNETAKQLGLVMGRVSEPMAVMITCKSDGTNAVASFDLMRHQNQVLSGEEDKIHAYNLFSGIYASVLEGEALPGGDGVSFLDIWQALPGEAGFILIDDSEESRTEALSMMQGKYPAVLLERLQNSIDSYNSTIFLVPEEPGIIAGKQRWAWLEIDAETYEAISVFDTGERSGAASYILGITGNKFNQTFVGYFVGMNCASWSIAAYSLSLDNYGDIKTNAALTCADVLRMLEEVISLAEKGASGYLKSKVKDKVLEDQKAYRDYKKVKKAFKVPLGFAEGFKIAVEVYFGL